MIVFQPHSNIKEYDLGNNPAESLQKNEQSQKTSTRGSFISNTNEIKNNKSVSKLRGTYSVNKKRNELGMSRSFTRPSLHQDNAH